MVTPSKHVARGRIYIAQGPWLFKDFREIFLPNVGEDQKKFYHMSAGPLALCHVVHLSLVIVLRF